VHASASPRQGTGLSLTAPIRLELLKERYGSRLLNLWQDRGSLIRGDLLFGNPIAQSGMTLEGQELIVDLKSLMRIGPESERVLLQLLNLTH
jgi:hypothetical protein